MAISRPMQPAVAAAGKVQDTRGVLRRLVAYLSPFRVQLWIILALVIVSAGLGAAAPALIGWTIDGAISDRDPLALRRDMLLLLATYVGAFVAQAGQIRLMGTVGQRFLANLRLSVFDTIQALPLAFFDRNRAGDLMSRLVNDIQTINQLVSQGLTQVIGSLFALVGILIAMLVLSPPLALASFVVLPLIFWVTALFGRLSRRAFQRTRETIGEVSSTLQEDIAGVRVTQAFNRGEQNIEAFARQNAANRDANVEATAITSAFSPTIDFLSILATVIVAALGGWLAARNLLPVGTVVAFFIYIQQFFRPIQIISNIYTQMQAAAAGAERIFALIDEPITQVDAPEAQLMPPIVGRVAFEEVFFSYEARTAKPQTLNGKPQIVPVAPQEEGGPAGGGAWVLNAINLDVTPGTTVALVGATGAGKSTLVNLIPRFYDATAGRVTIDGIDVRDVTMASLRQQIGIVLQESYLFAGSVADNIRYGRLDASDAEVEAAARTVGAHGFISSLAEGYGTVLGERGAGLSAGQRQLLTFARAVLADPRILILDEATSNVDTRTETLIQQALGLLLRGRTAFVIAHRLSTVRDADVVLVLDAGQIVERGTHDTLLAANGRYAELYRRQFRDEPTPA